MNVSLCINVCTDAALPTKQHEDSIKVVNPRPRKQVLCSECRVYNTPIIRIYLFLRSLTPNLPRRPRPPVRVPQCAFDNHLRSKKRCYEEIAKSRHLAHSAAASPVFGAHENFGTALFKMLRFLIISDYAAYVESPPRPASPHLECPSLLLAFSCRHYR